MDKKITNVPGRLHNVAVDEHGNQEPLTGANEIMDDALGMMQSEINAEQIEKNSQTDAAIQTETDRAGREEATLRAQIAATQKQDVVPVETLPAVATADPKKIYRVAGENSYSDYMVNAAGDNWQLLGTFEFPGIDDEPTAGSDNLVKSGGVYDSTNKNNQIRTGLFKLCMPNYLIGCENITDNNYVDFNDGEFYVHGTTSSEVPINIYNNSTSFPKGIKAGGTYRLSCSISGGLTLQVWEYINGEWSQIAFVRAGRKETSFTISQNATGLLVRFFLNSGMTFNDTLYPIICDVDSYDNHSLYEMLEKTFPIIEGSTLPNNTDLNSLTTTGKYFLNIANTYINNPLTESGYLEVERMTGNGLILQRLSSLASGYFYQRSMVTANTFGPWVLYKRTSISFYDVKIAMFGDSITLGRNGAGTGQVGQTIPIIVEQGNRFKTTNFGVGSMGWLSTQYISETAIDKVMSEDLSGYDVITYMFGTNDDKETIGSYTDTSNNSIMGCIYNVMNYVKTTYPNIIQILIGIPNTTNFKHESYGGFPHYDWTLPMYNSKTKADLDEEMAKFAAYYHIPYISLKDNPISSFNITALVPDNTHPNQDGYKALGGYIKGQLESILGS